MLKMSISSLDALFSTIVESWSVSNMGLLPPDTPEQWASILPFLAFFATIYLLVLSLNKAVFNLRRDTCLLISTCAMSLYVVCVLLVFGPIDCYIGTYCYQHV